MVQKHASKGSRGRYYGMLAKKYGQFEATLTAEQKDSIATLLIAKTNTDGPQTELDIILLKEVAHPKIVAFASKLGVEHEHEAIRNMAKKLAADLETQLANAPSNISTDDATQDPQGKDTPNPTPITKPLPENTGSEIETNGAPQGISPAMIVVVVAVIVGIGTVWWVVKQRK